MTTITPKDIEHLAQLARLELSEKENEQLNNDLPRIVEYVGQLQQVDTKGVEETSQVTGLENVTQPDEPCESNIHEELLKNAPKTQNNLVEVPKILK